MRALGMGGAIPEVALRRRRGVAGFDFGGGVLPAGASLTRASAASWRDAGGVLQSAGIDVARLGHVYAGGAWTLGGLVYEPQPATNLLPNSRDATLWPVARLTMPSATRVIEDAASGVHTTTSSASYTAGVRYFLSGIASEIAGNAGKRYLTLMMGGGAFGANASAVFDLATGTSVAVPGGPATLQAGMVATGAARWRCWLSAVAIASVATTARHGISNSNTSIASYAGDGASGFDMSDIQLESERLSSPVVTGASAATRAGETLVLDWGSRGLGDGSYLFRYTFDDGSSQDAATSVSGGLASVPVLSRTLIRSAALA